MKIINHFSPAINEITMSIDNDFNKLVRITNLQTKWSKENFESLELGKSYIKAHLRYSDNSNALLKVITNELKKFEIISDYKWITRVYPMIHLNNDQIEGGGGLHYDQGDDNDMFTCWLSITKNEYKPINIFQFENSIINYFKRFLVKFKFLKKISYALESKQGLIYLWSGHRMHVGNLNISDKISCAFQFKISKSPFVTEATKEKDIFEENNYINKKQNSNFSDEDILNHFNNFKKIVTELNDISLKSEGLDVRDEVLNYLEKFEKQCPKISFALSILSQRLLTYSNIFKENKKIYKNRSRVYDFASLIFGAENLISFKRLKKDNEFLEVFNDKNRFSAANNLINKIPNHTYQWKFIADDGSYKSKQVLKF